MLTVTVTHRSQGAVKVTVVGDAPGQAVSATEGEEPKGTEPNPIAPEMKEFLWAGGSFIVLAVLMRFVLYPRLRKGMDARYAGIRGDLEGADKVKADAQADVSAYERALVEARAEGAARLEAARQQLDSERNTKLAEVNRRIAASRAEADQKMAAAREAARADVAAAVSKVATRAAELATGRTPDPSVVQSAVSAAMESAGSR